MLLSYNLAKTYLTRIKCSTILEHQQLFSNRYAALVNCKLPTVYSLIPHFWGWGVIKDEQALCLYPNCIFFVFVSFPVVSKYC